MVKKLKRELQCTVCDQIPTSIPIPSCPMGHILCKECKEKIVYSRLIRDKPCPVCRSPLDRNTSYLASTLLSFFSDIPCSYKNSGCNFQGGMDDLKAHICQFKIVECYVCDQECMGKDFFNHNNKDCFLKDVTNTFDFPSRSGLYLVKGGFTLQEVLVDVWYVNNDDEDGVNYVGFNTFGMEASNHSLFKPSKMKIVVDTPEDPSFKMEVITVIGEGPYRAKKMADHDVVLAVRKGESRLSFELIY